MRIKKICKNCGAIFLDDKNNNCPICTEKLETVSFLIGRKIINLGGESRNKYIEKIIGHKLDPIMVQKQKEYSQKTYKEQKEYETIEDDIAAMEERMEAIDEEMVKNAHDFVKLNELTKEKSALETSIEEKMERWAYLEELAAKIAAQ